MVGILAITNSFFFNGQKIVANTKWARFGDSNQINEDLPDLSASRTMPQKTNVSGKMWEGNDPHDETSDFGIRRTCGISAEDMKTES